MFRREHDYLPAIADFVEAKDVDATVMSSDFDVAIARSKPLVDDFDDIDPTPAPKKGLWHGAEIRMRGNLNAHVSLFYLTIGAAGVAPGPAWRQYGLHFRPLTFR